MQVIDASPVQPGIVTRKAPWKCDLDWFVDGVMQSLHPTAMHLEIFWCFLQSCGESRAVKSLKFSTSLTQSDVIGLSWFFLQFLVLTKVQILGSLAAKLLRWPPSTEIDPGNSGVELLGDWTMKWNCRIKGHLVSLGLVMTGMASWMLERQWNGLMWTGQSAASQDDSGGRRSMKILRLDKVNPNVSQNP